MHNRISINRVNQNSHYLKLHDKAECWCYLHFIVVKYQWYCVTAIWLYEHSIGSHKIGICFIPFKCILGRAIHRGAIPVGHVRENIECKAVEEPFYLS